MRNSSIAPEKNPNPVIRLDSNHKIEYTNKQTDLAFPDLKLEEGVLAGAEQVIADLRKSGKEFHVQEITIPH